jgi:hypothetical protein
VGGTEPDLDLIKQVEQDNNVRFGRRLPGIRSMEIRGRKRFWHFSIHNFFLSLMFRCKEQQRRLALRTRQLIQLTPTPRFSGESRNPPLPWTPAFAGEAG